MRKNRLIQQKLNMLASSARLNPDTVRDAASELWRVQDYKKPVVRRIFPAVAVACALIVVIVVSVLLIRAGNNNHPINPTITPYNLNSLESAFVVGTEYAGSVPFIELENAEMIQKTYSRGDEIAVVATKIISVTENGTDEIIVYEDRGGGLQNFKAYQSYQKMDMGGTSVAIKTFYSDGEYYSYCYYENADRDYYISIMSPYNNAAEYYFINYL